jgi:quercetin dioxygenase-like cupin family protein
VFVVRTPPGKFVELHVHPYPETFVLLEGRGRWTAGDAPLLVVSVHESGTLEQSFLGVEPS